jgi:hypothetical protein
MEACRDRGEVKQVKTADNISIGIYGILGNSWRFLAELAQFRRYFNNAFSTLRKCIRKEG